MKTINFLSIALATVSLTSCGDSIEKSTYSINKEKSSLKWTGTHTTHLQDGSVKLTEGSVEMEADKLVGGSFKIDLNTIAAETKDLPQEKKEQLAGHLKDTSFFFIAEYPIVTVTVSAYDKGKLATIISVRGQEIKQEIPVKMTKTDKTITFSGTFDIDFSSLKMTAMQPEEGSEEHVQPVISFEMELTLDKK